MLSAAVNFLITAAVVYFLMVLPMAKYLAKQAQRKAAKEAPPEESIEVTELDVLKEIRDGLIAQRGGPPRMSGQGGPERQL